MNYKSLLPVVFLTINNFDSDARNTVEAGAHELVPFQSSWYGNSYKSRQVEETPNYEANNAILSEFDGVKPRKLKNRETLTKRTNKKLKKSHIPAKKKKKKIRKSKKKPAAKPRRFVKTTNAESERELNTTDSIEVTKRTKPVDIIVHIKVSE